jgi:hypothetical protein
VGGGERERERERERETHAHATEKNGTDENIIAEIQVGLREECR